MTDASTLPVLLERLLVALRALALVLGIVSGAYLLGRLLAARVVATVAAAADVDDTLALTAVKVTRATFGLLGVYLAVPLSGLATTPTTIAALSAGATIAVGFASRDVLSNLVSGAFLVVDPEFHVGDWIVWGDREGIVEDIGFRVTRVHTFDNEVVTVPNSQLTTNVVTTPVSKDRRRLTHDFGVGYADDVDRARELLVETALETEGVVQRPAPKVRLVELGESAVVLRAFFWIEEPARSELIHVRSAYVQAVKERFDAAGIELPYPTRELTGSVGTFEAPPPGIE